MQGTKAGKTPAQIRAGLDAKHGTNHGMSIPRPPGS
jgi:hypothetical protein